MRRSKTLQRGALRDSGALHVPRGPHDPGALDGAPLASQACGGIGVASLAEGVLHHTLKLGEIVDDEG
jgi:hypothetical protein